jgi:hypothetical protein
MPVLEDLTKRWESEIASKGLPVTDEERETEAAQNQPGLRFEIDEASLTCTSSRPIARARACMPVGRVLLTPSVASSRCWCR